MGTIIEQLADFTTNTAFEDIPDAVVEESKRLILVSIGCALAAVDHPKGRIAIEYSSLVAAGNDATILGTPHHGSILGAAMANGELIKALDMDAVVPPGHVNPYVLPGAVAISHEISRRIGKAMDYLRDARDGRLETLKVYGFASTIFGATAAIGMLQCQSSDRLTHSLSIAGYISPVQSMMAFFHHVPSTTIKYQMAGALIQAAMMAAHMGLLGHRGNFQLLDDPENGYPKFIGTQRWVPENITTDLGRHWGFPTEQLYKPYPHCRVLHGPLDCLTEIVEKHDIRPDEIERIHLFVEGFVLKPTWQTRNIDHVHYAQFSIAHGMAIGAHRLKPGRAWHDPENVFSESVLRLMDKVEFEAHPDYVKRLSAHASARPSRVEVTARGETFVAERLYPKGSPSPDPSNLMSTEELIDKFLHNAEGVLRGDTADAVVEMVMGDTGAWDTAKLMALLASDAGGRPVAGSQLPQGAARPVSMHGTIERTH